MTPLSAGQLLHAYSMGIFPMARERRDPDLYWVDPDSRGIVPLDGFHVPRSLKKTIRRKKFAVTCDKAFLPIMRLCAAPAPDRPESWINGTIVALFAELHHQGHAHSIEVWLGGVLVGGLYGLALGGAFFGESMASRATDASKVALVHLVAHLKAGGYSLLDTQFLTEHLSRFGAVDIPRADYHARLARALRTPAVFSDIMAEDPLSVLAEPSGPRFSSAG